MESLCNFGEPQPQEAYTSYTHGLKNRWSFLCRAMPDTATTLAPVEKILTDKLIPTITGHLVNNEERTILALPCRYGGLGLTNPTELSTQYQSSQQISQALQTNIKRQECAIGDALQNLHTAKKEVKAAVSNVTRTHALIVQASLSPENRRTTELGAEKGASSWLTGRPLKRHGFNLTKLEFRDGIHLRYNWPLQNLHGSQFTISNALSCPTGGYPSIRHIEIRDLTDGFLKRVVTNVSVEPHLQPLTGEHLHLRTSIRDNQTRLDVAANGIWRGRFECTYVDVRVFNPFASSNLTSLVPSSYIQLEKIKKIAYDNGLCEVEYATFVSAVFTATGKMGKCASAF